MDVDAALSLLITFRRSAATSMQQFAAEQLLDLAYKIWRIERVETAPDELFHARRFGGGEKAEVLSRLLLATKIGPSHLFSAHCFFQRELQGKCEVMGCFSEKLPPRDRSRLQETLRAARPEQVLVLLDTLEDSIGALFSSSLQADLAPTSLFSDVLNERPPLCNHDDASLTRMLNAFAHITCAHTSETHQVMLSVFAEKSA